MAILIFYLTDYDKMINGYYIINKKL